MATKLPFLPLAWHLFNPFFLLCVGTIGWTTTSCFAGIDEPRIERLANVWNRQRIALYSGEFRCRQLERIVPEEHNVNRDEVRELVFRLAQHQTQKHFGEIASALDPRMTGKDPPWSQSVFTFDGKSFRQEETIPGYIGSKETHIRHESHDLLITPRPRGLADQVTVIPKGRLKLSAMELTDLVLIPPESFAESAQIPSIKPENQIEKQLVVSGGPFVFVVDEETGFCHEGRRGTYGVGDYQEIMQFTPINYDGSVILPMIYFRGVFQNDRLRFFILRMIDEAIPNSAVEEEIFTVSVDAENTIIDRTGNEARIISITQPYDDVRVPVVARGKFGN